MAGPDLRCLEVMPNGDVKLTWIPPADPGNFSSYEIWVSAAKNGTFALVPSSLTSISTATFVYTTTVTTVQSLFYYMVMKYGAGGTNSSVGSVTLQTIFLGPSPGSVALLLPFNYIHTPKLPSSNNFYVINKEYPIGTWHVLATTNDTNYPDTLNICNNVKINYQVTLQDGSGCQSSSNLIVGTYSNTKVPEQPYVDSISVLPNGYTIIGWEIPLDKDVNRYNIQYNSSGTNIFIDSVMGRNNTSYTYTHATASSTAIGIFVQAVDSCGLGGTVNYGIRSMFLETSYDRCKYQSNLKWNQYYWSAVKGVPVESLGEYRIYYSVNGSGFNYIGSTTDTNYVHTDVAPGKTICYFVRVVSKSKKITASSNRACFFSDQVHSPKYIYLKTATIIDKAKAEIKVYLDNSMSSRGITIQRSENDTDFTSVGFIPFSGEAHYSFTDTPINSDAKSYFYKALVVDSCGNTRDPSNVAKTILLQVREDGSEFFTKQLSWNAYQGFGGGVSGYNIYRIVNDQISTALIGSTDPSTTNYTDDVENVAAAGADIEYLVEAVEGIGNPHGIFERSSSNVTPVYMEGNLYVPNAFSPTGVNKTWLPVTHFIEKKDYHVHVYNRWGKKVFESNDDTTAWDGSNCIADMYVYLIDYKNSRGEYLQIKGTVLLLR